MTASQKSMLDKALARAIAQDIQIVGAGTLKATGARVWFVTSGSGNGAAYMVVQVSPAELTCTCKAGQQGRYCKHRALITARLMHEGRLAEAAAILLLDSADAEREAAIISRNDGGPRLWR